MQDEFAEAFSYRTEYKKKSIRSYVMRAGRITEGQRRAFDTYWGQYGLSLFDGPPNARAVFGREAPLVLEIGFGMGDSLLAMAQAEPEKDFIGIEVHPPGVGRLINNAGKAGVKNLRVYMADALDVLNDCIPNGSLDRFQLYFPDPWHKKKHHKRRIVQPEFVHLICKNSRPVASCIWRRTGRITPSICRRYCRRRTRWKTPPPMGALWNAPSGARKPSLSAAASALGTGYGICFTGACPTLFPPGKSPPSMDNALLLVNQENCRIKNVCK